MKNLTLAMGLWLCAFCLYASTAAASNAAGGEITYQWLSDSTYRFTLSFYRDCSGAPEKDTLPLCFYNSCTSSGFTVFAIKATGPNGLTVPLSCNMTKTQCDSPASTLAGYRHWKYTAVVTLPSQCSQWKISSFLSNRNNAINITNATNTPIYLETILNNSGAYQGNSSPQFSNPATNYFCKYKLTTYNNIATDPDGDSLVTESITPRTGVTSCFAAPVNITYASTSPSNPPYNPTTNPIQTINSFLLNAQTGLITVNPVLTGPSSATVRTKEYRNGVLIGSVEREMQYQVYDCAPPPWDGGEGCFVGCVKIGLPFPNNNFIKACAGQPFSFCVDYVLKDTNGKIDVTDNHTTVLPGSTVTFSGQMTDSIRIAFSFSPTVPKSIALLQFNITDHTCYYPGIASKTKYTGQYAIQIFPAFSAGTDTTICKGDSLTLATPNYYGATWSEIPGGVLCNNCWAVVTKPTAPTKYIATSTDLYCSPGKMDTISVDFHQLTTPSVVIASSDTVITQGQNVVFTAMYFQCSDPAFQWKKNGLDIPGATAAVYQTDSLADQDTITCAMICSDTCVIAGISNELVFHVFTGVEDINSGAVKIHPNPNQGHFYLTGFAASKASLRILNMLGQLVYAQIDITISEQHPVKADLPAGQYLLVLDSVDKTVRLRFTIE